VSSNLAGGNWYQTTYVDYESASTSLVVHAVVLLLLTSGGVWPSTVIADGVPQEAQQAAAELIDRTYQLVVSHPNAEGVPGTRELRITVPGGGRFVVQPEHDAYVMGSDGTDYWTARRNGPVFVTSDFRKLAPKLQRQIPNRRLVDDVLASPDERLLLDVSSLLLLIERRYDIELVHSPNPAAHRVRARRRSGVRGCPWIIDFQPDEERGLILKAELNFADSRQRTLELVESPARSDQWYHHSEHSADRRVERLDAAD
jgi:hypothetical protein